MNDARITLQDDFLRITGQADAHALGRWLADFDDQTYAWEDGPPTKRYARSMVAEGGILLNYGRRNKDGLDAPQSDTRDSKDIMLEVPGRPSAPLLERIRSSFFAPFLQCPRRDIQMTFLAKDPHSVYETFSELVSTHFHRPAHRIGPDGYPWQGVSLQTHVMQAGAPRFAILYDKHVQDPGQYPQKGTLRVEFRFQPDKQVQKRRLFECSHDDAIDSWAFARHVTEVLTLLPREKSFAWNEPKPDAEFEAKLAMLVHSYGPTIYRGIGMYGRAFLERLALAVTLQANPEWQEAVRTPRRVSFGAVVPTVQ